MTSSADPLAVVSQRLESFFLVRRAETAPLGPEAGVFVDAAVDAVQGGKRLRARFLRGGWAAVREHAARDLTPGDDVVGVAAALEVFHAAALVHDDLVDNSDTRRGQPSAHRRLERAHRERAWHGDADGFGRAAAILLGDLLVAWSDDLLEEGIASAEHAASARREYAAMRRDVTVGQYLDVAEEAASLSAPDDEHAARALRVASYKSARYSVQQPILIGAALAGASDAQRDALAVFGHDVGIAFQLRDDVLGVFGDAAVTGKPSGDDLREGKRTVLIAYAREHSDATTRARIDSLLGDREMDGASVAWLQRVIVDSGALARTETLIEQNALSADTALQDAPLGATAVAELRSLARAAIERHA